MIEVAAAVIQRADGSFLLAQRPPGKVYAGYWEFPGGKIEPGEDPARALSRELHEELGIDVERAYPWITRVFRYPHGTVRLAFYRVHQWRNEPHPREEQALSWQRLDAPLAEPMLPANAPVLASLALPVEYGITDAARLGSARMLALLERRLQKGLKLLQVREPSMAPGERAQFTQRATALAHRHACKVLTKEAYPGADGLHLTAAQLMQLDRKPAGLIGASVHTREELERAIALELDFAVLGPVKEKSGGAPLGWQRFASLAAGAGIPIYAIGGLTPTDLEDAWSAGAHGLAMIRGAWR